MNLTYKLIKNKFGELVVTSELAKKSSFGTSKMLSGLLFLSVLSVATAGDLIIDGQYNSAKFIFDSAGKIIGHIDIDNHQKTTQSLNSDTNIKFGNINTYPVLPNIGIQSQNFRTLWEKGYITIYDKNNNDAVINFIPNWDILHYPNMRDFTWDIEGEQHTIRVHDLTSDPALTEQPEYFVDILVTQPNIPYYDFSFAKSSNGIMWFNDVGKELNVSFTSIKNSSLFISEGTSKIVVGGTSADNKVKIKVDFTAGKILGNELDNVTKESYIEMGPTTVYSGDIKTTLNFTDKKTGISYDGNFTINNFADLANYQQVILAAIENGRILSNDYNFYFNQAFKNLSKADYQYYAKYEYDPDTQNEFYFSDEMKRPIDVLSIFKSTGINSSIEINEFTDISAIGGHILYGSDRSQSTNNTSINLLENMGNAYIDNGAKYNNKGILIFGYNSKDGTIPGSSTPQYNVIADRVKTGAVYTNEGKIFVGTKNGTAVVVEEDGSFINEGDMYIASVNSNNTISNGVLVRNGNWENKGNIYIGKGIDANGDLFDTNVMSPDKTLTELNTKNTHNALYTNELSPTNSVVNSGKIIIGSALANNCGSTGLMTCNFIKNAVGMNIEHTYTPDSTDTSRGKAINKGEIFVGGMNSIGMRVHGNIGQTIDASNPSVFIGNDEDGVINVYGTNSAGIVATGHAIVYNKGTINVYDSGNHQAIYSQFGNFGIRAEGATVYMDGAVNLEGDNAVGFYARVGAKIHIKDINSFTVDPTKINQIQYWMSGREITSGNNTSSTIVFDNIGDIDMTLKNDHSIILRVDDEAESNTAGAPRAGQYVLTVAGDNSTGIYVADAGTRVITGKNLELHVTGNNSKGIFVTGGSGTNSPKHQGLVHLTDETTITIAGKDSAVAVVDGHTYDLSGKQTSITPKQTNMISDAKLTINEVEYESGAIGYKLINLGKLTHNGEIDFTAPIANGTATGILVDGGILENLENANIQVDGVGVDIYGQNSRVENKGSITAVDGIAALRLNEGASVVVKGATNGTSLISGHEAADAIKAHAGTQLTTDNAQISVDGKGAGIHYLNINDDSSGAFRLSGSGVITVKGDDAIGILVEGEDTNKNPIMGTSDFLSDNAQNLVINVVDQGGHGITVNTSGKVHSGASVNIQSQAGQSALVVKGATVEIVQSGNLTSESLSSPVVELKDLTSTEPITFTNLGSIKVKQDGNNSTAGLVAINANINKNIHVINGQSGTNLGEISGIVEFGNNTNTATLFGGSKGDQFVAAGGNTTIMLKDVGAAQSENLFNKLLGGNGHNDSISLSASAGKNSHYVLSQVAADNIVGFERLDIYQNSNFEFKNSDITLNESVTNGGIHLLDQTSTLFINHDASINGFEFGHNLYGNGVVKTNIKGKSFAFDDQYSTLIGDKFTGKLQLENAVFDLRDQNTEAMTKATLVSGINSQTLIRREIGVQNIGGLVFNGGRMTFQDYIPDMNVIGYEANGSIHAKVLDFTNPTGTIDIHVENIDNTPTFDTDKPVIEQDVGVAKIKLVGADQVIGISTGALKLDIYDTSENLVPQLNAQIKNDIVQNNKTVAIGTYGYGLQAFENPNATTATGLYVAYKLNELELLTKGNDAFILHANPGAQGHALDLSARVTGAGDLVVNTATDYISLSHNGNDYTGITDVQRGHLMLENNDVLGKTSLLNLRSGTQTSLFGKYNTNGVTQSVGAVTSVQNSALNLGKFGELTVLGKSNSNIAGFITGDADATLKFEGAHNTISSINSNLKSDIEINNAGTVLQTYHARSLGIEGTVLIDTDAELRLGNYDSANTAFNKKLNGVGEVFITESLNNNQKTASHITFTADNSNFTGDITIGNAADTLTTKLTVSNDITFGQGENVLINHKGTLDLNYNGTNDWLIEKNVTGTGGINKRGKGTVELNAKSAQYTGTTNVIEGLLIAGTVDTPLTMNSQLVNIHKNGHFLGTGETLGSIVNSGNFSIGYFDKKENDPTLKYTVHGDFTNQSTGIINLNVKYPDGDNTSRQNINPVKHGNIGNELIIKGHYIANGGSIVLNTVLNEGFEKTVTDHITVEKNVIKQGAPTKLFVQNYGGFGARTNLDAIKVISVNGQSDLGAFVLGQPATIGLYEYSLDRGQNDHHWYLHTNPDRLNPEVGGYLTNMITAFELFNVTLHDRLGNPTYSLDTRNNENGITAWGRIATTHRKYNVGNHSLAISGDYYLAQFGADLVKVATEKDGSFRFGIMAGYGSSDFTSRSRKTGNKADAKIDQALSAGIYATWYQPESWFIDTWLQYSHFKNEVSMKSNASNVKYNSDLLSGSIEVGYNYRTSDFSNGDHLIIQPNVQLIYGHLSTNAYRDEVNGVLVNKHSKNNLQSRVGMKIFYVKENNIHTDFRPYIEANWLHNSVSTSVLFNNDRNFSSNAPKDIYEVKVGVEGDLSKAWSIWGNVGYQMGKQSYKGYKATVGVKYTW